MSVRAFDSCRLTIGRGLLYARIDNPLLIVIPSQYIYIYIRLSLFIISTLLLNNLHPSYRDDESKGIFSNFRILFPDGVIDQTWKKIYIYHEDYLRVDVYIIERRECMMNTHYCAANIQFRPPPSWKRGEISETIERRSFNLLRGERNV